MKTTKVEILPDGKSCKTLNPLGTFDEFNRQVFNHSKERLKQWRQAESERKTYVIDFTDLLKALKAMTPVGGTIIHTSYGYEPGEIHDAEIINETHCRIV